jgi:RecA-family ATPase
MSVSDIASFKRTSTSAPSPSAPVISSSPTPAASSTSSKLDLIIADPLFSYFGGDLSDQGEVSVFLRNKLQPILHETKVAWIWMHHVSKPQRKDGEPLTTMELAHSGFGSQRACQLGAGDSRSP